MFSQILREIESRRELCEIELIVFFIHSALHTHISAHDGAGMNILKKERGEMDVKHRKRITQQMVQEKEITIIIPNH